MITLQKKYIDQVNNAREIADLYHLLQNAIELEHSTIPPYLTAMFSLKPGTQLQTRAIIHSIVIEEMLHMSISANILNALGGKPAINRARFVPKYPGPLPMGIGDGLQVSLEKYSQEVVKNVFMAIEEPENPLKLRSLAAPEAVEFNTIGDFYMAIQDKIEELADDTLPGDPKRQVTSRFYPKDQLFPILTKEEAIAAIDIIIEQGEGTSTSPVDQEGEIAHYYKFEELYREKHLVKDPTAPHGYSYSGPPIPFDPANVWPLFPNTKQHMLPVGSEEWRRLKEFNESYRSLLDGLHHTFNGHPHHLDATIGLMFDLKLTAEKLAATAFPGKEGYTIGPSFEFLQPEPLSPYA